MDPRAIRAAVAGRLATLPDVRPLAWVPGSVPPGRPTVVVVNPAANYISYLGAMSSGLVELRLTLTPWVPFVDAESASARLDELVAVGAVHTRSIYGALMVDRTLGGLCSSLAVESVTAVQAVVDNNDNVSHLVADINVLITAGRH